MTTLTIAAAERALDDLTREITRAKEIDRQQAIEAEVRAEVLARMMPATDPSNVVALTAAGF